MPADTATRAPILCLEGPSGVGKTTLASALASAAGAAIVPELAAANAPPVEQSAAWFVERHVESWERAVSISRTAPLVVIDGDPFKGLWYNWVFADAGWPGVEVVAPLYREQLAAGRLAFPDVYAVLLASESQLRARRAGDATRSRRNFETHLRLLGPHQRYFEALQREEPRRVLLLDSSDQAVLVPSIMASLAMLPRQRITSSALLDSMAEWIATHDP